jgi:hypothetical protein
MKERVKICRHGHTAPVLNGEIAATDNERVNELLVALFRDGERCATCAIVALEVLLRRARYGLKLGA